MTFLAIASGLAAHIFFHNIHEVPPTLFLSIHVFGNLLLLLSHTPIIKFNTIHFTTLLLLTITHRLFLSPLRSFPGPPLAPISKLVEATHWFRGENGPYLKKLHQEHGDFIRTGPYELSINNVEAVKTLYTRTPDSQRGPFYTIWKTVGERNILTVRDDELHQRWRRIWEKGFRGDALMDYSPRLEMHTSKMVSVLESAGGKEVEALEIMGCLGFDIMADLSFGMEAGMLDGTGDKTYRQFLHDYMRMTAVLGCFRPFLEVLEYMPKDKDSKGFIAKGELMLENRLKLGTTRRDVFSHLLGEDSESGCKFTKQQMNANAQLLIVAGGDSTGGIICNILRELALHPVEQQKLRDSLRFEKEAEITVESVKKHEYLEAVINETLRLWAGVPSGVQVISGPNGITVAGKYVPPRTAIRVPSLALMTDERYFVDAEKWIPERFAEKPELVKDRRAFIPFSQGPHVCIGKHLALNELRLAIARIVWKFKVLPGPSFDDAEWRSAWRDFYSVQFGKLHLKFVEREQ